MKQPDALSVRTLRIHLPHHQTITWQQLSEIAGYDLCRYMVSQPDFPEQDLTEEDGLHWKCRTLAKWMKEHPVLAEMYAEGKRNRNPSGLCQEDYERNRLRKLGKLV